MKKISVGKIVKAQGIKGEVKISCNADDLAIFDGLKTFEIDGVDYEVIKSRQDKNCLILQLKGVNDRNHAESLVGSSVCADKSLLKMPPNRHLVDDLVGCRLYFSDGAEIGELTDILQIKRAADVLVINDGQKEFSVPFLKDVCVRIDVEKKRIECDKERFLQVVCYQDEKV